MMNYCIFERAIEVPAGSEEFMYDANQKLFALLAAGNIDESGFIQYHGSNRMVTDSKINVLEFSVRINSDFSILVSNTLISY